MWFNSRIFSCLTTSAAMGGADAATVDPNAGRVDGHLRVLQEFAGNRFESGLRFRRLARSWPSNSAKEKGDEAKSRRFLRHASSDLRVC